jgi:hypothetical protein
LIFIIIYQIKFYKVENNKIIDIKCLSEDIRIINLMNIIKANKLFKFLSNPILLQVAYKWRDASKLSLERDLDYQVPTLLQYLELWIINSFVRIRIRNTGIMETERQKRLCMQRFQVFTTNLIKKRSLDPNPVKTLRIRIRSSVSEKLY